MHGHRCIIFKRIQSHESMAIMHFSARFYSNRSDSSNSSCFNYFHTSVFVGKVQCEFSCSYDLPHRSIIQGLKILFRWEQQCELKLLNMLLICSFCHDALTHRRRPITLPSEHMMGSHLVSGSECRCHDGTESKRGCKLHRHLPTHC